MSKQQEEKKPRIPISQDPERLTKAAERVEAMAGNEQRLCCEMVQDERFTGSAYWLEPSGKRVDREAAQELIRKGRFRPLRDGLFEDAASQSFERVGA